MVFCVRCTQGRLLMEIYAKALELSASKTAAALAIVVDVRGSTPQKVGAKAIVDDSGKLLAGTVGGGLLESRVLERGVDSIHADAPELFKVEMEEEYSREAGPICGGTMTFFVSPIRQTNESAYSAAQESVAARGRGALVTVVGGGEGAPGDTRWVREGDVDDSDWFPDRQWLKECVAGELPALYTGQSENGSSESRYFVEPMAPLPRLLVVGGGHVGQAVAQQGVILGFEVTVLDDRPSFTESGLFPEGVTTICGSIGEEVGKFPIEKDTYIVLVSKGHRPDAEALESCIHSDAAYIGMIGSKRKVALLRSDFLEKGTATEEEFDSVFGPVGLDIGSVSVPEIATSIMAQVVAIRRKGREAYEAVDLVLR